MADEDLSEKITLKMDTVKRSIPMKPDAPSGRVYDIGEIKIENPDFADFDMAAMAIGGTILFDVGPYRLRLEIVESDAARIDKHENGRLSSFLGKVVALIRNA